MNQLLIQKYKKIFTFNLLTMKKDFYLLCFLLMMFLIPISKISASTTDRSMTIEQIIKEKKITINLTDKTLKEILSVISEKTKINYGYQSNGGIDTQKKFSLNVTDATVEEALNTLFKGSNYTYSFVGDKIIIEIRQTTNNATPKTQKKITVTGKILDNKKQPVAGATVIVSGSNNGAISGEKGEFSLTGTEGQELEISYVGMIDKKYILRADENNLTIELQKDEMLVDDVVVIGYQSVRRERLTGSTTTVTSKDIEGRGLSSINEALSNSVAGLNMVTNGRPGADSKIQIRGINSINGSTEPMWIVDGMPMQGEIPNIKVGSTELQSTIFTSGIGNIAPDDIKSITVLKDAAATAIYGARAANGVIVVETKSGLVGKTRFNVSANVGLKERPVRNIEMMNTQQKIQFEREIFNDEAAWIFVPGRVMDILRQSSYGVISKQEGEKRITDLSKVNTDWFKEIFRTAVTQQYNFSMSGGTKTTQHYTSVNYQHEKGTEQNNKYNKLGMSTKITHSPNEKIRITGSLGATLREDQATASAVNSLNYAMYANPYEKPYNDDGSYAYDLTYNTTQSTIRPGFAWPTFNILHDLNSNTERSRYIDADIQVKLEWELIKGLMFTTHGVYNINANHNRTEHLANTYTNFTQNWYTYQGYGNDLDLRYVNGSLSESTGYSNAYTWKNTLQYNKEIKDTHYISLFAGQELSERTCNNFLNYSPVYDDLHNIVGYPDLSGVETSRIKLSSLGGTGRKTEKMSSFFANASYSYKDRYIATGALRYDGADIIGNANQFTPLWNVGLRWNLHKEKFMENVEWVNLASLRGGFGYTGSIDKEALPFLIYRFGQSIKYDGQNVPTEFDYPNPNIKWQKKQDMNIGLDLSLLDYRIELSVNYYDNITRDVLDNKRLAISSGRESAKTNVADLYNKGVEIDLGFTLIKRKNVQWFAKVNYAYNENKVKNTFYKEMVELPYRIGPSSSQNFVEDYSAGSWFGYKYAGINPMTGGVLAYTRNGDATLDFSSANGVVPNTMIDYLGLKYPPHVGGFSTSINFYQFVFSASFEFKTGHNIKSFSTFTDLSGQNRHVNDINRWRQPGDITNVSRLSQIDRTYRSYMFSNTLESGDYLKCSFMTLGYNIPPKLLKKIGFNTARISMTAKDLFTITKYRGIDPLLMGEFGYPNSRKYTFTLNLGF